MEKRLLPKEGLDQTVSQTVVPPSASKTGIKWQAGMHARKW